ncbi:MAG TPA: hypothetical protein VKE22_01950 [Haliangiales bacterium]|nr:hypothetical protein [Haliangiales bacterium]
MENQLIYAAVREKDGRATAGVLVLPWERRGDFHRRWRAAAPAHARWKRVRKRTLRPMVRLVDAFLASPWLSFRWRAGGRDALAHVLAELPRGDGSRRLRLADDAELVTWLEREMVDESGAPLFASVRAVADAASPPLALLALLLAALDAADRRPRSRAKRRFSAHVEAALAP